MCTICGSCARRMGTIPQGLKPMLADIRLTNQGAKSSVRMGKYILFFSYETLIGLGTTDLSNIWITPRWYSKTTSKHINEASDLYEKVHFFSSTKAEDFETVVRHLLSNAFAEELEN